ncbi:Fatty acid hydroxylase superfamily protein [Daejeonella lutea]|uniref:Fatty acid hydroxylase superfamily protein n=2 Tax=Daejeonella lutea TaxID=572036 RepID=A0A1T5DHK6_9SPHI|nr:Fatty acid hydroxylase superfamily protein [Daejeonella lutea]
MILSFFGATAIPLQDVYHLQETSPDILLYAVPVVCLLTLAEFLFSRIQHHNNYDVEETIGSIITGVGSLFINLVLKIVLFYGAVWIYKLIPWRIEFHWWTLVPCYIIYDFCSYWAHRIAHYNRFFWATHVVHHSAEYYNLTVSFRVSWVQHIKIIFFLPLMVLGFHPLVFFIANQLGVLYQFWVHTESIGKLHPFIEKHFGTPSNHRVHHGSNEKYLDKNFGATFMIWDHIFKSFQYEQELPNYGLTTGLNHKINPLVLNFHEYFDMIDDVKNARTFRRKLFYIFASPSMIQNYKLKKIRTSSRDVIRK